MSIDLWCHLICLNFKIFKIFKSVYDTVYENDGVKNGTKVRTYETLDITSDRYKTAFESKLSSITLNLEKFNHV